VTIVHSLKIHSLTFVKRYSKNLFLSLVYFRTSSSFYVADLSAGFQYISNKSRQKLSDFPAFIGGFSKFVMKNVSIRQKSNYMIITGRLFKIYGFFVHNNPQAEAQRSYTHAA